jgi:hypothetical protein
MSLVAGLERKCDGKKSIEIIVWRILKFKLRNELQRPKGTFAVSSAHRSVRRNRDVSKIYGEAKGCFSLCFLAPPPLDLFHFRDFRDDNATFER